MKRYHVKIIYCPGCRWLLRSAWMAQELLQSFDNDLEGVTLAPAHDRPGLFEIWVDNIRIWSRKEDGGFPQVKDFKQRFRDLVDPDRDLGHLDNPDAAPNAPQVVKDSDS